MLYPEQISLKPPRQYAYYSIYVCSLSHTHTQRAGRVISAQIFQDFSPLCPCIPELWNPMRDRPDPNLEKKNLIQSMRNKNGSGTRSVLLFLNLKPDLTWSIYCKIPFVSFYFYWSKLPRNIFYLYFYSMATDWRVFLDQNPYLSIFVVATGFRSVKLPSTQ